SAYACDSANAPTKNNSTAARTLIVPSGRICLCASISPPPRPRVKSHSARQKRGGRAATRAGSSKPDLQREVGQQGAGVTESIVQIGAGREQQRVPLGPVIAGAEIHHQLVAMEAEIAFIVQFGEKIESLLHFAADDDAGDPAVALLRRP